jgi:hypothetical protein
MQRYLQADNAEGRGALGGATIGLLGFAWQLILIPVLTLLVILEPIVTFVLAGLALLGVLTTLFFKLAGPPGFPVWTMLAISVGFAIALVPYHVLIRLLSR